MIKSDEFWLIDNNSVGVIRFYKKNPSIHYMIIEEGIIMGIHGENAPLMKRRKEIKIDEARILWKNLIREGWQKTSPRWE